MRDHLAKDLVCLLEHITQLSLSARNRLRHDRPDDSRDLGVIHQLGAGGLEMLERRQRPGRKPKLR